MVLIEASFDNGLAVKDLVKLHSLIKKCGGVGILKDPAQSVYGDFKKWWARYEADISSTPMPSAKGIAFDAWLAAIKLVEEKFTAINNASVAISLIEEYVKCTSSKYRDCAVRES